jgi:spore germination protein GerM
VKETPIETFRRLSVLIILVVAVALGAAAVVGCGGPSESDSDTGSAPQASDEPTGSDDATAGPMARVAVYFVDGEVVVPVSREVAGGDLDAVVAALFAGPTEADRGALGTQLTSEIPAESEVVSLSRSGSEVEIEVSEPFVSSGGALGMRLRLAQLVYTLTSLQDVERVLLLVEGQPVRVVGEGLEIENPLTREQYASVSPDVLIESPLPGDEIASPMIVSGTTVTPGTEFILRLTDTKGTVVTERLVTSDGETGLFGIEVEYDQAEAGQGTLYALSLSEDVLTGVTVGLK